MQTIVDGKKISDHIASKLKVRIQNMKRTPSLAVITVGEDVPMQQFVKIKKRFGERVGANVSVHQLAGDITADKLKKEITRAQGDHAGVILQLPVPGHIDTQHMCGHIRPQHDPDVLSEKTYKAFRSGSGMIPPVAKAVAKIIAFYDLDVSGKSVLVVGKGRLVGQPVYDYFKTRVTDIQAIDKHDSLVSFSRDADIIVSGAGAPHIITPEMVKEGVWLFDAGTAEQAGELRGDISPDCKEKAAVFSPVPGGIGPITVACLFENVALLSENR